MSESKSMPAAAGERPASASSGAVAAWRAALACGVDVCFANPGTTEMPLVAALEGVPGMRAVLGLFEGVCTGAADGYGRMTGRPALTLLHLGPGLANGIANLHNARRARTPIVNLVGDHARWHLKYDAPLTSDIASLARPVSGWYRESTTADALAGDVAAAIEASLAGAGRVATLVVPVDLQSERVDAGTVASSPVPTRARGAANSSAPHDGHDDAAPLADEPALRRVTAQLRGGAKSVLLLGASALGARGQEAAGRIAVATGARLFSETFPARTERGGGLPDIDRLPYFPEPAIAALADADVILAGAIAPVAYFGYAGLPSELAPAERIVRLAGPDDDAELALVQLADALGANGKPDVVAPARHAIESGPLTPIAVGRVLANALPEDAIVSVEGGTCGYPFVTASAWACRHTVLTNTGGAIGQGLPVALGAAIACPSRRVFALQSDGSAQYTIQALWTMARERLPIVVLIVANRRYGILQTELARAGVSAPGESIRRLTLLDDPAIDWAGLARGYGVAHQRAATTVELEVALDRAIADAGGPQLIELVLP